jgi:predicted RNA binding protein YcfA (HicA-like mRNA interferase family)
MPKLPVISGKEFVKFLENNGFKVIRTKGSHVRLFSNDDKYTTIPVHNNEIYLKD